jgi:hypothetical protein
MEEYLSHGAVDASSTSAIVMLRDLDGEAALH